MAGPSALRLAGWGARGGINKYFRRPGRRRGPQREGEASPVLINCFGARAARGARGARGRPSPVLINLVGARAAPGGKAARGPVVLDLVGTRGGDPTTRSIRISKHKYQPICIPGGNPNTRTIRISRHKCQPIWIPGGNPNTPTIRIFRPSPIFVLLRGGPTRSRYSYIPGQAQYLYYPGGGTHTPRVFVYSGHAQYFVLIECPGAAPGDSHGVPMGFH